MSQHPLPGGMSAERWQQHQDKVREYATQDVITGRMPLVLAAALWGVLAEDLQRWVATARASTK